MTLRFKYAAAATTLVACLLLAVYAASGVTLGRVTLAVLGMLWTGYLTLRFLASGNLK